MNEIYIFGHKNPDTDSVTAAISIPQFVLDYFKVKKPEYLNNVKLQIKDLNYKNNHHIKNNNSIYYAYNYMTENGINNVTITNEENKVCGLIAMKNIAKFIISGDSKKLNASFDNLLETLEGTSILKFDETITGELCIAAFKSKTFIENINIDNKYSSIGFVDIDLAYW